MYTQKHLRLQYIQARKQQILENDNAEIVEKPELQEYRSQQSKNLRAARSQPQ